MVIGCVFCIVDLINDRWFCEWYGLMCGVGYGLLEGYYGDYGGIVVVWEW